MKVEGNTAVITGSTGRLGGAIALALAKEGCDCICHYHTNKQLAEELVEQITCLGQQARAVCADLTEADQIDKLFAETGLSPVRILVNSAGIFFRQKLSEVTFADAQMVLNTNLTVPILLSRRFVEIVGESEPSGPMAKIINIVDVGGIRPWAGYSVYCASKAGLIAVTKSLAKELAPQICVNAIAPGIIAWPKGFDEAGKERQLAYVPMGRIGKLDEIVSALKFLLENDYITGQVLNIDGGRCI